MGLSQFSVGSADQRFCAPGQPGTGQSFKRVHSLEQSDGVFHDQAQMPVLMAAQPGLLRHADADRHLHLHMDGDRSNRSPAQTLACRWRPGGADAVLGECGRARAHIGMRGDSQDQRPTLSRAWIVADLTNDYLEALGQTWNSEGRCSG